MTTHSIFKATRSSNYMTQAQRSRMRGPILPMERPSLFARIRAWLSRLSVDRREGVL